MDSTNFFFTPGKLSIIMDGGAGSSGKGKIASYVCEKADNWQFACNTFTPQAGHWVKLDDGREYFYQSLNSCTYQDKFEMMFIGPGSGIELPALMREIEENNLDESRLRIHPLTSVLQEIDPQYEMGLCDIDGNPHSHTGTMKFGSTAHGCGICRARKVLRRQDALVARDVGVLKPFISDVSVDIMDRLDRGQAGLLEIAQGFQLSLNGRFFPYSTSRNVTVSAGMDDMMLPVHYAGNVLLNFRTYPIRINNKKYLDPVTGNHLTWEDVEARDRVGLEYDVLEFDSGPGYDDQRELMWDDVSRMSGSPHSIIELTSVTKLPRRVFSFSKENLRESVRYNRANGDVFLSINFINYVDYNMLGHRNHLTEKAQNWLTEHVEGVTDANLAFIGTGPLTEDVVRW